VSAPRTISPVASVRIARAAIYARISREDEDNVDNTDIQIDECLEFINHMGWQHADTYRDDNISAYSGKRRDDYQRLIADIEANKIDLIVATEMTRLNRRLWHSIDLFRMAETTTLCRIATTDGGGADLSTREGIQTAVTLAIEAEKESLRISVRQKRKHRALAKDGKANGGPRPYGYERSAKGTLEINEPEAAIVREIVRRLRNGESARSIVADLRARGLKTAGGRDWHYSNLKRLIESPRLCGMRTHLGTLHPSLVIPAIISRKEWEDVQSLWEGWAAHGIQSRRYLLSGIVVCGRCDTPMVGRRWHDTRTGRTYNRYICTKDEAFHHRAGCGKVFRNADPIDILVTEAVLYRLDSPDFLAALSTRTNEKDLQDLLNQRQAKLAKRDSLYSDYLADVISRELWLRGKGELEDMVAAINRQLSTLQSGRSLAQIPLDGTLAEVWGDADLDFKRDLIKLLVKKVVVLPGRTQAMWRGQWRFDPSLIRIVWEA
jgi:site-specific DNA recombinase